MRILRLDAQKSVRKENLEYSVGRKPGPKVMFSLMAFVIGPALLQWIRPHAPVVAVYVFVMFIEPVIYTHRHQLVGSVVVYRVHQRDVGSGSSDDTKIFTSDMCVCTKFSVPTCS
jgi:hypothetical protein